MAYSCTGPGAPPRGGAFLGEHTIIGVSRPRENRTFDDLVLNERLAREGVNPLCHLAVVNLSTGDIEHRLVIEGVVEELYDIAALHGIIRPMAIGFRSRRNPLPGAPGACVTAGEPRTRHALVEATQAAA